MWRLLLNIRAALTILSELDSWGSHKWLVNLLKLSNKLLGAESTKLVLVTLALCALCYESLYA